MLVAWKSEVTEDDCHDTFGDISAGGEVTVTWTNPACPESRIQSIYGVCRDDVEDDAENEYPFYVAEQTEFITGEDYNITHGEGSFRGFATEDEAMQCARNMARHEAGIEFAIDWNGETL